MFRLLLSLIYLALTFSGAILFYLSVDEVAEPLDVNLRSDVEVSHIEYNAVKRLRDLQLRDLASGVAQSEIKAYLSVLMDKRNEMLKLEAKAYEAAPGEADVAGRQAFLEGQEEFLSDFSLSLASHLEVIHGKGAWSDANREEFVKKTEEDLADCMALSVPKCLFEFTYKPLKQLVEGVVADNPYGIRPDLVIVSDDRGTGLADFNKPKWSNDTAFSERYSLISKVKEGVIARDVVQLDETDRFFFVAAAPVMDGDVFRGTVMVGVEIDESLLREEGQTTGWNVSYFDGQKLIRSSLSEPMTTELTLNIPPKTEEMKLFSLNTENLAAQFVPVGGNFSNHDVQVVLSRSRADLLAPIGTIKSLVWLYGLMMFLIGMALFIWIIRTYTKPLIEIDTGIHEIMNGNHEYEFRSDYHDRLWSAMAQSLNRMVGILLGHDLEDEDLEEYLGVQTKKAE